MTSYVPPENHVLSVSKNYTIASTFEKVKSLKFELLFGNSCKESCREETASNVINAVDYFFAPGQIFGFACQSFGAEFSNFHHVFILRACAPGESGNIITGISPGAEILVKTMISAASVRVRSTLRALTKSNIDLSLVSEDRYRKLHQLLEAKMNTNYFVDELIAAHQI